MLTLRPYNDFSPTSNWSTFYYFKNVFNDQMIQDLEKMVYANYEFSKGTTGVAELGLTSSYKTNNRDIAYIASTFTMVVRTVISVSFRSKSSIPI